jgi:hypothetical protein
MQVGMHVARIWAAVILLFVPGMPSSCNSSRFRR